MKTCELCGHKESLFCHFRKAGDVWLCYEHGCYISWTIYGTRKWVSYKKEDDK